MKCSRPTLLAVILSLNLVAISCSRDSGSDFFRLKKGDAIETLPGVVPGGDSGDAPLPDAGLTSGGASSSGGSESGGSAATGSATGGAATSSGSSTGSTTGSTTGSVTGSTTGATGGTTVVKPPSEKDICEPLKEDGEEILYGHGLVGKLYDGAPNKIEHFKELLEKGLVIEGQIFMSKLNIPTRKFEKGFPRENGTMVMNAMGQTLVENFGIEFTGQLELQEGEEGGYYEIGVISDDGSVLEVKSGDDYIKIIDGDHVTPSKFFCAKNLLRMEQGKPVPMRLRWFQGPRYNISLIMMWRKVLPLSDGSDSLIKNQLKNPVKETRCGIAGNKFFFDPESSSHPTMEYQDLFDPSKRVVPWSIVKHKNFRLPMGYSNMECVTKNQ